MLRYSFVIYYVSLLQYKYHKYRFDTFDILLLLAYIGDSPSINAYPSFGLLDCRLSTVSWLQNFLDPDHLPPLAGVEQHLPAVHGAYNMDYIIKSCMPTVLVEDNMQSLESSAKQHLTVAAQYSETRKRYIRKGRTMDYYCLTLSSFFPKSWQRRRYYSSLYYMVDIVMDTRNCSIWIAIHGGRCKQIVDPGSICILIQRHTLTTKVVHTS